MFLSRGRSFVGQFFRIAQSSLVETGPRVSAVKLMHTIQFYNNGQSHSGLYQETKFLDSRQSGSAFKMQTQPQHPAWRDFKVRRFSTTLATAEIEARVLNVCKAFDKVSQLLCCLLV